MLRSIRMPIAARDQEGERQRDQQRGVEQVRRGGADDLLHDEGRVGAQHHHLAMRHVDHAHGAEGDGEPDRRQQQHRAERDAVPDVLRHLPGGERLAHRRRRRRSRPALTSPSDDAAVACSTPRASRSPRSRTRAMASSFCAAGASEASTLAARASLIERLMRASFSTASAWSRAASDDGVAALEERFGGAPAHAGIGAHQGERADGRLDDAAQAVVDPDAVELGFGRRCRPACRRSPRSARAGCRPACR